MRRGGPPKGHGQMAASCRGPVNERQEKRAAAPEEIGAAVLFLPVQVCGRGAAQRMEAESGRLNCNGKYSKCKKIDRNL